MMNTRSIYPFTAIVGQERMKRALILNAVDQRIGGVLIRGERGTAKSTAARAMAALLPEIEVIAESPFNDDPHTPQSWSDWAKEHKSSGQDLKVVKRKIGFIDLPVSATEDRVVGTLDIEKAIKQGEKHFEPGVLAAANRGLLYIDEVNLLDDHVVDLLLDSASRVAIMERNLAYEADPQAFRQQWMQQEQALSRQIEAGRQLVESVLYTRRDLLSIAALTSSMQVDGHRSDLVILKAAKAHAALEGRR